MSESHPALDEPLAMQGALGNCCQLTFASLCDFVARNDLCVSAMKTLTSAHLNTWSQIYISCFKHSRINSFDEFWTNF